MASALEGLTVLDIGTGAAAALASMFLSDHGARVVRVIAPGDAVLRDGGYIIWDRGKECVTLDLDAAAKGLSAGTIAPACPAATWTRLIAGADMVLDDFAPSSPRQALVARDWLTRQNPRLVACSITAYGRHGPLKDEPAIDDLVLARMGVLSGMPGFRPAPVHLVHPLPSVGAALFAVIGITAALYAREKTGRGRGIETSLMAGALLYHPKVVGEKLKRHVFQTHPSGSAPFYSVYACKDGRYVQLGCVHVNFIRTAATLMGLVAMIDEPRFDKGRGGATPADEMELRAAVAKVMATRTADEWSKAFEEADVPYAPARRTEEGLDDPQVKHNRMVITLDDPALGSVTQMGVPVALSGTPGLVKGARAARATDAAALDWPAPRHRSGADAETELPQPLDGVRVLEITNLIAGPTAGRILADLGADVIKLEPPEGDMSRPIGRTYFYHVNFNKRSVCIDARADGGKAAIQRIAASADALLANLRPQATERMGIGPALNPRLIEAHLTGYGATGPYAARPGIDPLAQAYLGLSRAQGGPDNPPVFPAQLAPTDYTNGAMGAFGIITALYVRERTGKAQRVDCNLLSGGIMLTSEWFSAYRGRPERPLADKEQMGLGAFHRLYKLADGWIYVVVRTPAERSAFCRVAGVKMANEGAGAARHSDETALANKLAAAMSSRQANEMIAALKAAGVPVTEVVPGDSEVFLDDPHSHANHMVVERQHPTGGRLRASWGFVQFAGTRPSVGRPTPLLGQHTADVLRGLGYTEAGILPHASAPKL